MTWPLIRSTKCQQGKDPVPFNLYFLKEIFFHVFLFRVLEGEILYTDASVSNHITYPLSTVLWESLPLFVIYYSDMIKSMAGVGVGIQNREPMWFRHTPSTQHTLELAAILFPEFFTLAPWESSL